jgi:hypothetical protein
MSNEESVQKIREEEQEVHTFLAGKSRQAGEDEELRRLKHEYRQYAYTTPIKIILFFRILHHYLHKTMTKEAMRFLRTELHQPNIPMPYRHMLIERYVELINSLGYTDYAQAFLVREGMSVVNVNNNNNNNDNNEDQPPQLVGGVQKNPLCPPGQVLRFGSTRKSKQYRGSTRKVCAPGIGKLKEGQLAKFGYSDVVHKTTEVRRAALDKAVKEFGALSVFRKLNAVYVYTRKSAKESSAIFKEDRDWVKGKYM